MVESFERICRLLSGFARYAVGAIRRAGEPFVRRASREIADGASAGGRRTRGVTMNVSFNPITGRRRRSATSQQTTGRNEVIRVKSAPSL